MVLLCLIGIFSNGYSHLQPVLHLYVCVYMGLVPNINLFVFVVACWIILCRDTPSYTVSVQDFCICIEMFLAAIAHYFSFSHKPYVDDAAGNADCWPAFKTMLDVSDVHADVVDHIQHVSK